VGYRVETGRRDETIREKKRMKALGSLGIGHHLPGGRIVIPNRHVVDVEHLDGIFGGDDGGCGSFAITREWVSCVGEHKSY
jgi:hypothetical protein